MLAIEGLEHRVACRMVLQDSVFPAGDVRMEYTALAGDGTVKPISDVMDFVSFIRLYGVLSHQTTAFAQPASSCTLL